MIKYWQYDRKDVKRDPFRKGILKRNDQTQIKLGHLANYLGFILTPKMDAYGPPPQILIGPLMKTQVNWKINKSSI